MLTENEDPTLKTVGPSVFTDRHTDTQTHTQTHTQTDRHDRFYDSCPSLMGNYKKQKHKMVNVYCTMTTHLPFLFLALLSFTPGS